MHGENLRVAEVTGQVRPGRLEPVDPYGRDMDEIYPSIRALATELQGHREGWIF